MSFEDTRIYRTGKRLYDGAFAGTSLVVPGILSSANKYIIDFVHDIEVVAQTDVYVDPDGTTVGSTADICASVAEDVYYISRWYEGFEAGLRFMRTTNSYGVVAHAEIDPRLGGLSQFRSFCQGRGGPVPNRAMIGRTTVDFTSLTIRATHALNGYVRVTEVSL